MGKVSSHSLSATLDLAPHIHSRMWLDGWMARGLGELPRKVPMLKIDTPLHPVVLYNSTSSLIDRKRSTELLKEES